MTEKTATFTFGRFSPPTTGHQKLVGAVHAHAKQTGGDHFVFPSHSHDPKKNPLPHHEKVDFMRKVFPKTNVVSDEHVRTAIDAVKHLHKQGYKKVTMVVGSDRVEHFHNLLHTYNGKEYHIPHLEVKSAGHRDPDADGVEGMSASKMREHAAKKDFKSFREGVPVKKHAKELYTAVRRGMKLESHRALFLVGGPGSGKDVVIKTALSEFNLPELALEKLHKAILDKRNLQELYGCPSIVVNGNSENFEKVMLAKKVLEAMNYETAMVYVYTTDEKSKERNDARFQFGLKTISEETRKQKYESSRSNMTKFFEAFDAFYLFDNSNDFRSVTEEKQAEITSWLNELQENLSLFFEKVLEVGTDETLAFAKSITPGENYAKPNSTKNPKNPRVQEASADSFAAPNSRRPAAGTRSATCDSRGSAEANEALKIQQSSIIGKGAKSGSEQQGSAKVATKKAKVTNANRPSSYFDSRIGAVPSGGIGLVAHAVESKIHRSLINGAKKNV